MNYPRSQRFALWAFLPALVLINSAHAAGVTWNSAGAGLLWSTPANWLPVGVPGPADAAFFNDTGAAGDTVTPNNTVGTSLTILSLAYGQTNGIHNTLINPGVTLSLSNTVAGIALQVGTETDNGSTQRETNSISGAGGTLAINHTNGSFFVRQGSAAANGAKATLDLSALDTFTATVSQVFVGVGNPPGLPNINRNTGTLYLARTNTIRAVSGTAPAIDIGKSASNNGGGSLLYLGQTNAIFTDSLATGREKETGCSILFNPAFTSPVVYFRGANLTNRIGTWSIGDGVANSGTTTCRGTNDFTGGTVDAQVNTLIVGRAATAGTGANVSSGILTFDRGTIDVNTLQIGLQTTANVKSGSGTVNVNGTGTLVVNTALQLTQTAGSSGAPASTGTLNVNGGTVLVNGSFTTGGGTANLNLTNGLVRLPAGSQILARNVTVDGGVLTNAALVSATNALVIANGGVIAGSPAYDLGTNGTAAWDVSGLAGGLMVSNALSGGGNVLGDVTQAAGAIFTPGGANVAGMLGFGNNLTLNGGKMTFDLSGSGAGVNDQITVGLVATLAGTNDITLTSLSGTLDTATPYTILSAGTLAGDATKFRIVGPVAQSRYNFTFDTAGVPNTVRLIVGGAGSASLRWVGDGSGNTWNLNGTANWNNGSGADKFFNLDQVTFDDTGSAAPAISLVGSLAPAYITMNNVSKSYLFGGTGSLAGGGLTNAAAGSLTISNSAANSFSAPVDVEAGTLTIANSGLNTFSAGMVINNGNLNFAGASTNDLGASGLAANAGTVTFNPSVDSTFGSPIAGAATVIKEGTKVLTLAGNNANLTTVLQVKAGTLKVGSGNSLPPAGVIVSANATLDVNGQNSSIVPVTITGNGVAGNGAIISTATAQQLNALRNVTLAGNASIGGAGVFNTSNNTNRWDIRAASTSDPSTAFLNTGGQPYQLTKVGSNQVSLVAVTVDPALGDIDIQAGLLGFETVTTSLGDPTRTLTVRAGGTLSLFNSTNQFDKKFVLFGDGVNTNIYNWSGNNTMIGPVTINGSCVWYLPAGSLTNRGTISGTGSLIKGGTSPLLLAGTNSYTGTTTIASGRLGLFGDSSFAASPLITIAAGASLDVSTRTDGALDLVVGQTLKGNGNVFGSLVVSNGATVAPGASVGALNVSNVVTLLGACAMELDAGNATNDVLRGAASIVYGGTLQLTNLSGALAAGGSFKLFDATSYSGSFASIEPATPGAGLAWDAGRLTVDGTLRVVTDGSLPPQIGTITISGGNVVISGTGGVAGNDYYVRSSTNLALAIGNWPRVMTNKFQAGGSFSFTSAVNPADPQRFYRVELP